MFGLPKNAPKQAAFTIVFISKKNYQYKYWYNVITAKNLFKNSKDVLEVSFDVEFKKHHATRFSFASLLVTYKTH